jgi:hypothetical protein
MVDLFTIFSTIQVVLLFNGFPTRHDRFSDRESMHKIGAIVVNFWITSESRSS